MWCLFLFITLMRGTVYNWYNSLKTLLLWLLGLTIGFGTILNVSPTREDICPLHCKYINCKNYQWTANDLFHCGKNNSNTPTAANINNQPNTITNMSQKEHSKTKISIHILSCHILVIFCSHLYYKYHWCNK